MLWTNAQTYFAEFSASGKFEIIVSSFNVFLSRDQTSLEFRVQMNSNLDGKNP